MMPSRRAAAVLLALFPVSAGGQDGGQPAAAPAGPVTIEGISIDLRGVSESMRPEIDEVLERETRLAGDTAASPPLADDLAYFVRQRYLIHGYSEAQTDWRIDGGTAVILVTEGARLTVGAVSFPGADAVPEDELEVYLTRSTREREGRASAALPFVLADIEAGTGLVQRRLQAEGYLNAEVGEPVFEALAESGTMRITVPVVQGNRFAFGPVEITVVDAEPTGFARERAEALTGKPFSETELKTMEKEVQGSWQEAGWYAAEARAVAFPDNFPGGAVPVHVTVVPGHRFTVTGVETDPGFSRGAQRVASSILGAVAGDIYSPDQLDLLHRRTLDTGVFARLDVEPRVTGPDTLVLTVTGEEAKPKTLGFYGGFDTYSGVIVGAEARHANIFDSGNSLGLRAEVTGRGYSGSLQFVDPAVLASRNSLTLDLSAQNFSWRDDYTRRTLGFRGTLTRRITRRITAEGFAGISLNDLETDVLTPAESGPRDYRILSGGGRLIFDFRDSPLVPEDGWTFTTTLEGGRIEGDAPLTFLRPELSAAWYRPLTDRLRFAVGIRMAAIETDADVTDIPIDSRLFNGGATSVRSFPERELGPRSKSSVPLGGTSMHLVSAELSRELFPDFEIALFGDAGSVGRDSDGLFSVPDDWRYAVGAGIRYKLPVGPLRLDYGFNPDRREGEPSGAFHLTFGFAF